MNLFLVSLVLRTSPLFSVSDLILYKFSAPLILRQLAGRPVSCYAFFKGWLLLSRPPGCLRLMTSFDLIRN